MSAPSRRIILLGPRGSGKTVVGSLLARKLGVTFLDLDFEIQRYVGMPITDIFADVGDPGFRELEADALKRALASDAGVIATGGGVVVREPNRELLKRQDALRIFLNAQTAILWHRVRSDPQSALGRPALTGLSGEAEIGHVMEHRLPFYVECSTHEIDTTHKAPAEVVEEILKLHRARGGERSH